VCRAYGADWPTEQKKQSAASSADASCPHDREFLDASAADSDAVEMMDDEDGAGGATTIAVAAAAAPLPSYFAHNFELVLQCFLLHLRCYPSFSSLLRSRCERHRCVLLLLRLWRDARARAHTVLATTVHRTLMYVLDLCIPSGGGGGEGEANGDADDTTEEFRTVASLFLSPSLRATHHELVDMIDALRIGAATTLLRRILRTCALALLRSTLASWETNAAAETAAGTSADAGAAAAGAIVVRVSRASLSPVVSAVEHFQPLLQHPAVKTTAESLRGVQAEGRNGELISLVGQCCSVSHRWVAAACASSAPAHFAFLLSPLLLCFVLAVLCGACLFGAGGESARGNVSCLSSYFSLLSGARAALGANARPRALELKARLQLEIAFARALYNVSNKVKFDASRASVTNAATTSAAARKPTGDAQQTTLAFPAASSSATASSSNTSAPMES
jgi:hypothetical protein